MSKGVVESFTIGAFIYEKKLVDCGKERCSKCPHGPYWYMKIPQRTGKVVTKYLGKELPQGIEPPQLEMPL